MGVAALPTIVNATTGAAKQAPIDAVRVESFKADDEANVRAEQLTRMQANVVEATQASRSAYRRGAKVFEGVTVGTGGAKVVLEHRLGRPARWQLVDFTGAAGASLVRSTVASDRNDENALTLLSYAAGVATIEVF
jgi:hypothetical protein